MRRLSKGGSQMRRIPPASVLIAVALLGLLVVAGPLTGAQDATPAPIAAVGVTTDMLGSGQPDAAPGQALAGRRNTYEPGGFTPTHHHPGALVVHVESGELTYTVIEGTVQVHRAATASPDCALRTARLTHDAATNPYFVRCPRACIGAP